MSKGRTSFVVKSQLYINAIQLQERCDRSRQLWTPVRRSPGGEITVPLTYSKKGFASWSRVVAFMKRHNQVGRIVNDAVNDQQGRGPHLRRARSPSTLFLSLPSSRATFAGLIGNGRVSGSRQRWWPRLSSATRSPFKARYWLPPESLGWLCDSAHALSPPPGLINQLRRQRPSLSHRWSARELFMLITITCAFTFGEPMLR